MQFKLKTLILGTVTTLFDERSQTLFSKFAEILAALVDVTGAAAAFLPSYMLLEALKRELADRGIEAITLKAAQSIPNRRPLCLLDVVGGHFSEGVELPVEVPTVVVIGLPIPPPLPEIEAKRQYFDAVKPGLGFTSAYVLPAIRKVVQAVGRVLRNPRSKKAVILADKRYASKSVLKFLPRWLIAHADIVRTPSSIPSKFVSLASWLARH
jgi:DNA excision repair protein ERCC-2